MSDTNDEPVMLDPAADTDDERLLDHPDEITDEEAEAGLSLYRAVDDTDDESTGLGRLGAAVNATALKNANIMKAALLRHGVPEVSIELMEGRPASDPWNACKPVSVISHHIASNPTVANPTPGLSLVKKGRSDLPGPLANGYGGMDLVYRILTCGLANHPGLGGPWTVKGPCGTYVIPKDVARPYAWGTEYEGGYTDAVWNKTYTNKRTGMSMTYREFMGRANAAICEGIWLINGHGHKPAAGANLSGYHGEHKTWAPTRKIDRLNYSTASGRAEIIKFNEEDDVSAEDVWTYRMPVLDGTGNKKDGKREAGIILQQAHNRAGGARKVAAQAYAQAVANKAAIAAIAKSIGGSAAKEALAALDAPLPEEDTASVEADESADAADSASMEG